MNEKSCIYGFVLSLGLSSDDFTMKQTKTTTWIGKR